MIGILILVVFLSLLGKALVETAWGGCQIIWGVICQTFGIFLLALANVLDFIERPKAERRRHGAFSYPVYMKTVLIALLATLATTLTGVSQEPTKPGSEKPTQTETQPAGTLPAARTITDTKGRAMEGTVLAKSATAITFERAADRKRFEIALDTLSDADKAFIAGLAEQPVKKPRVLAVGGLRKLTPKMETAGFDVTVLNTTDELKAITDQELEVFDAIVVTRNGPSSYWAARPEHIRIQKGTDNYIQRDRILNLTSAGKVVAWRNYYKVDLREFIENKREPLRLKGRGEMRDQEPFVDVQGNAIFYSWTSCEFGNERKKGSGGEIPHEEIFDQLIDQLKLAVERKKLSSGR